MKLVTSPFVFKTGDVLDPHDLNRVWRHAAEAVTDTFQRRFKEVPVSLSFSKDVATGYTNADNIGIRTFKFHTPTGNGGRITITRAFLSGNINSAAEITVKIQDSSLITPTGCTDPWLSIASTGSVDADVSDFNPARFKLEYNTEYQIRLESSGAFTVNHLDLVFHIEADRFAAVGGDVVPTFSPTFVSEADAVDATTQNSNKSNFDATTSNTNASSDYVYTPSCFVIHGLNVNSAATEPLRWFALPKFGNTRSTPVIMQLDLWFYANAVVGSGNTIEFELLDPSNVRIAAATFTTTGGGQQSGFATFELSPFYNMYVSGVDSAASLPSYDLSVRFVSTTATTIEKAFGVVWMK